MTRLDPGGVPRYGGGLGGYQPPRPICDFAFARVVRIRRLSDLAVPFFPCGGTATFSNPIGRKGYGVRSVLARVTALSLKTTPRGWQCRRAGFQGRARRRFILPLDPGHNPPSDVRDTFPMIRRSTHG